MEGYSKRLTFSAERESSLVERIEAAREVVSNRVLTGEIGVLDSTQIMGKLARESVVNVAESVSTEFDLEEGKQPFALFFFGSPSRNLMLPNSDLDVGLVFSTDCPKEIRETLGRNISALPFDKIDIASWSTIGAMRKENCPDMIEYNKAIDARFVVGNVDFAREHERVVVGRDTKEEKIKRFITEYGILHRYDYLSKRSEHGPNLKYDFGASRDIIFLDWYSALHANQRTTEGDIPFFVRALTILQEEGTVVPEDRTSLMRQAELVLLVKFILLSKFRKGGSKSLVHLSNFSLHEAYKEAPNAFKRLGITDGNALVSSYYEAKLALHGLVEHLYTEVCDADSDLQKIWETAEEKTVLDEEVVNILGDGTWYNLIPFAIRSKSPEILNFLVSSISDQPGYEYVLRIVSENKFINYETKKILLNSRLAEKFKIKLTTVSI